LVPPPPGCEDVDEVNKTRPAKRGRSTSPEWQPEWTMKGIEIKKGIDQTPVFHARTCRNTSARGYLQVNTPVIPMQETLPEIITEKEQNPMFPARTHRNTHGPVYYQVDTPVVSITEPLIVSSVRWMELGRGAFMLRL